MFSVFREDRWNKILCQFCSPKKSGSVLIQLPKKFLKKSRIKEWSFMEILRRTMFWVWIFLAVSFLTCFSQDTNSHKSTTANENSLCTREDKTTSYFSFWEILGRGIKKAETEIERGSMRCTGASTWRSFSPYKNGIFVGIFVRKTCFRFDFVDTVIF